MAQWFYTVGGQRQGPVSEEELRGYVAQGRVGGGEFVWTEGMANWQRADSVFAASAQAAPPAAPPPVYTQPYPGQTYLPPGVAPHRGGMVLAFGIIGLVFCIVFGILAWVFGNNDLRAMQEGKMDRSGESMTSAGRICGMIGVILHAAGIIIYVVAMVLFFAAAGTAASHHSYPR